MRLTHKAGLGLALFTVAGLSAPQSASAQAFDAAQDFSATNNPNGAWSYGYETTLGAKLNLYTVQYAPTTNIKGWNHNIASNVPFVQKNFGSVQSGYVDVILQPGQLMFHPGPDDEFSVVRFTAPAAGLYTLNAGFTPVTTDGTTTDVHILDNGTSLFSGLVTGTYNAPTSAPSFSGVLNLKPGDIVDFAVGYGANGNYFSDSTGLSATLSAPVPEASSIVSLGLLLLLGLGGVAVNRRRRAGAAR